MNYIWIFFFITNNNNNILNELCYDPFATCHVLCDLVTYYIQIFLFFLINRQLSTIIILVK